jgi:RNA polymerase sigma-70 factor (ECF subfamily)
MKSIKKEFFTDQEIVKKIKEGDKDAFCFIVDRYQKGLINFIFHMIGHYEESLELCQEAFLKVYSNIDLYDRNYKFSTWIYKIASNLTIDHLRKNNPRIDSLDELNEDDEKKIDVKSEELDPIEKLEKKFVGQEIADAIISLEPHNRELIILRHIHFRSYEEIAKITNLPLGTIKNRIFRARKELVEKLRKGEMKQNRSVKRIDKMEIKK